MSKERYRRGAHTVTDFKYHFVWKTKYGYNVLKKDLAVRLRDIVREICSEHRMEIIKGNVRSNHIHVLISAPAHLSPAKIIQYLKGKSSYRLQREFHQLRKTYWGRHLWARGYFGSTVGAVTEAQIKQYIENQSDEADSFKVWDEPEKAESDGSSFQSDLSE
ncbi:MAG: IS200/IS605 family transposase [Deltaproteobacteria bacterium]|nr:IS200/IS605 family transposase [Deltaproteobacteria bacterium]